MSNYNCNVKIKYKNYLTKRAYCKVAVVGDGTYSLRSLIEEE